MNKNAAKVSAGLTQRRQDSPGGLRLLRCPSVKAEHGAIPGGWMHSDARRMIDLFHRYPNARAALSGYLHLRNRVDYDGVSS